VNSNDESYSKVQALLMKNCSNELGQANIVVRLKMTDAKRKKGIHEESRNT